MLVADDLDRFVLFNNRDETLGMGREECQSVEDVEEGEISDSASVEGITKQDFSNQEAFKVSADSISNKAKSEKPRVWTMQDLYKYQISRNYASGLYNLAWAQAVQNKPLDEVLVMEYKPNEEKSTLKLSSSSSSVSGKDDNTTTNVSLDASSKEMNNKAILLDITGDEDENAKIVDVAETEKEEGELEEGEIGWNVSDFDVNKLDSDAKGDELERRIDVIREALESVTISDADKSYDAVCSQIRNSLDSLWEMVLENSVATMDALVQLSFSKIQSLNSVFCSMNQNLKEQNKYILSRLLYHISSQSPPLFLPEQIKEIEFMILSLESGAPLPALEGSNKQNNAHFLEKVDQRGCDVSIGNVCNNNNYKKGGSDFTSVDFLCDNEANISMDPLKLGSSSSKGRGLLLPLLDLHKDHDEDSLPSPTRATPSMLPVVNVAAVGSGAVKPEWPVPLAAHGTEDVAMPYYETDVLKAVSTYQQKFGRTSFHMADRLPSPTPSEECDGGNGDTSGEVSSSSIFGTSVKTVDLPNFPQSIVSSELSVDISSSQGQINIRNTIPVKSSSKSRDPRLRFANPDIISLNEPKVDSAGQTTGSRKQKPAGEPVSDGPTLKRQKNGSTDSRVVKDVPTVTVSGGWLEDRGSVGSQVPSSVSQVVDNNGVYPFNFGSAATSSSTANSSPNVISNGFEHLSGKSTSTAVSWESLLKDIAVNPAIWMNIIKMEQQKFVDPVKSFTHMPSSNSILGTFPSVNVALPKTASTNMLDELEKIRMKPRDPRRALHSNMFPKVVNFGPNHIKTSASSISSSQEMSFTLNSQKQNDQSDKKVMPSQTITPPDITRQFTKNLKNIADIVSVSQASMAPPVIPEIPSSQPSQVYLNRGDVKDAEPESGNNQSVTISSSEEVAPGPSRTQNAWGDVEHLFEGLDDKQKAAFHKERARRIEEQKKMFAARKLCLVLDLDHTLLNSAKFAEVDPMHDEILRKKEEQDREKPYRHLFRFPHMGMWTKLRPGIWNFLEKASKLFELHLYTMGNKLYATEMAKLLDPKGALFAGRVISRGDDSDLFDGDERVPKIKDLEGVLGMESGVIIIDDSVRVWPHNKLNLIVVERYIYFPCSRRQFGLLGPSLLEIDHDERPEAGTLASSLAVIERIHQNFFAHRSLDDADVRNILASEQRKILAGCRIVFSRVFPVGEANPHLHPLWQSAEQFGAVCTNQIDEQVTHVVANSLGTDKVNWALSTGRFVVHPGWVEASALLYRRANEHEFAIKP